MPARADPTSAAPAGSTQARPQLVDDLVFDVGMHRGEDTAYYLRKGFRVVAFEAHPELVEAGRNRFAAEIAEGRVEIVAGAITDEPGDSLTFYAHSRMSAWGTTSRVRASRNEIMGPNVELTVKAVDFVRCLDEYGVPHYLKIDIEATDMLCLVALRDVEPDQRPRYASIEGDSETWAGVVRQLNLLEQLGYTRFAIVQQARVRGRGRRITTRDGGSIPYRFEVHSSGPFGDDLGGVWLDKAEAMRRYRRILPALRLAHAFDRLPMGLQIRFIASLLAARPLPGWFDIHAAR